MKNRVLRRVQCLSFLIAAILGLAAAIQCNVVAGELPFQPGEKLTYRISWSNFMEAGRAEMTVTPKGSGPDNTFTLRLKAFTTAAISTIYPFKDEFLSLFDVVSGAPTRFEKSFVEKKRTVKEITEFDQMNRLARWTGSNRQTQRLSIPLGTQDPLSALYMLRGLGLKPGLQAFVPVLDGGRLYQVEFNVVGNDLISTQAGSFMTHRVDVRLWREGAILNNRRLTVWLTADGRRLPVLASAELPFGTALVEITSRSD